MCTVPHPSWLLYSGSSPEWRISPLLKPVDSTRRAFRHGRLDLLQVEGLADVLEARTEGQRRLAMRQFLGAASTVYL